MYLLDTNVCIDFLTGRSETLARRMGVAFGNLTVSAITVAELLVGGRASADPDGDMKRIDTFVATLDVAAFDREAARAYGALARKLGVKRSSFDRLIGAQALALGLTLVTRNERGFSDIPTLQVENWTLPIA